MQRNFLSCIVLFCLAVSGVLPADEGDVLFWWKFDEGRMTSLSETRKRGERKPTTLESVTNTSFSITGLANYVPGVSGSAIKFDGFSSYVEGVPEFPGIEVEEDEWEIEIPGEITIEAWLALGAYPWNWAPIITIGKYKITGFYFGID